VRVDGRRLHPDTLGLTVATFRQTTSRADDPQLHTHAVISAKVQTEDGRWLALDGRYLKRNQRMLGGLYQSVLRAELTHRYGVTWEPIVNGQAEIAGDALGALAQPVGSIADYGRTATLATLGRGAQGDVVVWAQEHLRSAGQSLIIDGAYGPATSAAVMKFQRAHALPAIGMIGPATWQALLRYPPVAVRWTAGGARTASAAGVADTVAVPPSASLPAKRYEIGRSHGSG